MQLLCAACGQSLFGIVRHCPFCGARQTDQPDGTAPAASPSGAGADKALTRFGDRADRPLPPAPPPPAPASPPADRPLAPAAPAPAAPAPPKAPAVTPPPAKPPAPTSPTPTAPAPVVAKARSGGAGKWLAMLVIAGGAYAGWEYLKPKPPDACQLALDSAASALQGNQFAQAKSHALAAIARCTAERQDRARVVLKAVETSMSADDSCAKALRLVDSQIGEGKLKQAQRTLDAQPGACLNRADAAARRQRLETNRAGAAEKLAQAQTLLADGQFDQARKSVDDAERLDRENADLAKTRKEIETKSREVVAQKAPPAPVPQAPPKTEPQVPPKTLPPGPAPQPTQPSPSPPVPQPTKTEPVRPNIAAINAMLLAASAGNWTEVARLIQAGRGTAVVTPGDRNASTAALRQGQLLQQSNVEAAVGHYRNAVALDPSNPVASHQLLVGLIQSAKFDEAVNVSAQALTLEPASDGAWFMFSQALAQSTQPKLNAAQNALRITTWQRRNNAQFIDFEIGKLNLTPADLDDLVAFLKGLTDQRVVYRKAPFDAPQLFVPNGHRVVNGVPAVDSDGTAADVMMEVPAVGRNGGAPLKGFLQRSTD